MKNIILIACFVTILWGCKSSTVDVQVSPVAIVTANAWKINRFTPKDNVNKTLTVSDLGAQPFALTALNFVFKSDNTVRAVDISGQIPDSGTWYLKNNNATMDFDVNAFAGTFDVVQITNTKMIIRIQKASALFPNLDNTVNWEFVPAL